MNKRLVFKAALLICSCILQAQDYVLKLSSKVELRTWTLNDKAVRSEKILPGASVTLYQDNSIISQGWSDFNGDFTVLIPANGDYILTVSYTGCNTKKISINTNGAPSGNQKVNSFSIQGFVMSKPIRGIDYSLLQQSLAKIAYVPKDKSFDDNKVFTQAGLDIVAKITEEEDMLLNQFCANVRSGDAAFAKADCSLARKFYNNALALLPDEKYPLVQLEKADACIKTREEAEKMALEAIAKAEQDERYNDAIKKGDEGFVRKNWDASKQAYNEALAMKPDEPYPQFKLAAIDKMVSEEADKANAEKIAGQLMEKYNAAVKRADGLFAKKLWTDAEDAYYEALGFFPNEKHPKTQIVAINKILSREYAGNDKKFKEAIEKAQKLGDPQYIQSIKKMYEDALTYEEDAAYLKRKAAENAALKNQEHTKAMLEKYPPGITEEIINGNGVVIVKRVLVKDSDVWVYQKKIFNWGGITCFRDDATITEGVFENETRL